MTSDVMGTMYLVNQCK